MNQSLITAVLYAVKLIFIENDKIKEENIRIAIKQTELVLLRTQTTTPLAKGRNHAIKPKP